MAKIMIADDEQDIRESVKLILEVRGYKVILAKDGDECLQLAKKEKPDLILLDILMPGIPVNLIVPKLKGIKIIFFSVVTLFEKKVIETGENVPDKSEYPNVVDYIRKPFELEDLLSKIKKALK
jgi:CheY-like chemotaxis protein